MQESPYYSTAAPLQLALLHSPTGWRAHSRKLDGQPHHAVVLHGGRVLVQHAVPARLHCSSSSGGGIQHHRMQRRRGGILQSDFGSGTSRENQSGGSGRTWEGQRPVQLHKAVADGKHPAAAGGSSMALVDALRARRGQPQRRRSHQSPGNTVHWLLPLLTHLAEPSTMFLQSLPLVGPLSTWLLLPYTQ